MTVARLFRLHVVGLLLLVGSAAQAQVQADPPARVARLNFAQGPVVFAPAGDNEWTDASPNRPLTRGDRLWTDSGSRAEIQVGSSAVRLDGQTRLEILALDDQSAQLSVTQGTVYVRVRSLPEGENFEVDTPHLAYRAAYPGDYRLDVDPAHGTTRVTIHSGTGAVYGESGQALPLGGGQQVTFRERSLAQVNAQEAPPQDAFDRWALERNRQEDHSISARHVPREVVGYQQLDASGQWSQDPTYGAVWYPRATPKDWAPYRHGHWEWVAPWGWTWIDDAPWGFAPFHYGRWALIESRWAWVPGWLGLRPVYAPALVAFIGGSGDGVNWSLPLGAGRPGVAWFPLAPGEAWQPGFRASPVYISNVNRNAAVQATTGYAYQRRPEALTAISAEDFHRGRPAAAGWLRVAANLLTNAQIVPPPPMPEQSGVSAQARPAPARVAPPASAEVRQVIAKAAPASAPQHAATPAPSAAAAASAQAAQARAQVQRQADAHRERLAREQAQRAAQAKAGAAQPPAKPAQPSAATADARAQPAPARDPATARAEQAIARASQVIAQAEQARRDKARSAQASAGPPAAAAPPPRSERAGKRAAPPRREQLAKRAEPAQREQPARRTAQARQEQHQAQREHARREQLARRADRSQREQQAKRADQAKREAQARREEQLRREAHAQRVEEARKAADRDAQALREQRAQREEQARRAAEREAQALRAQREEQARREAQQREQAQREAWERQQQALAEQWKRDHQQWEQRQRERPRPRPDLRDDRRGSAPEVWQRGIPILTPGRTS